MSWSIAAYAADGSGPSGTDYVLIIVIVVVCTYLLPTSIAYKRRHRSLLAIFVMNLIFGWTLLGWGLSLVWACTSNVEPMPDARQVKGGRMLRSPPAAYDNFEAGPQQTTQTQIILLIIWSIVLALMGVIIYFTVGSMFRR